MKYRHLLLFSLALTLVHCSHNSDSNPSDDGDITVVDLPIQIKKEAQLEPARKEVAESVKAKKGISFRKVTQLMIEKHVKAANNSSVNTATMQAFVSSIAPSASLNPAKTKVHYEEEISKKHGGKPMIYNASKFNIVDIYNENRVQCYSGTYMYELVRRQQKPSTFRAGNEVVIFTSGHVQPGYMIKQEKGYVLMAIETTLKGGGRYYYGSAENLVSGITVVDAELFALIEIFADEISNPVEVANAAIKATAKKYGIPAKDLELSGGGSQSQTRELNQSIFAFGAADMSAVDKERDDSGDDAKEADATYFQMGMNSASKMPRSQMFIENNCSGLTGGYVDQSSYESNSIFIEHDDCKKIRLYEFSLPFAAPYHVDLVTAISTTEIKFELRREGLTSGSEKATLVFDAESKTILWIGKLYVFSKQKNRHTQNKKPQQKRHTPNYDLTPNENLPPSKKLPPQPSVDKD